MLREVEEAAAISDDAMREVFNTFEFVLDTQDLPPDPFSAEYMNLQFALYRKISGRNYSVKNEMRDFVKDSHVRVPFSYYTQSYLFRITS